MYTFDPDGTIHRLRRERDRREVLRAVGFAAAWVIGLVAAVVVVLALT